MGQDIKARGGIGRREAAPTGPMYTENGGSNIRLAILAPEVQGDIPDYLPLYIQGLLNNNIKKFSAINLIDRQNLNRIISEQNIAASGRFSDKDFVSIGNLTNTQYFLFGTIQKLSGNRYSLQLSVTEASTGVRKANFMKDGAPAQFEGNGTILNEATAELLEQLGIHLTTAGKQALLAGNTSMVLAEAGLARGITAQAGGSEVNALFNFAQAITFDPSQFEALSRLNTLSSSISGGTISQRIVNDIQSRDQWIQAFKETARFFNNHPPFEIIFDPNLIQIGETDFAKRTATLGMRIKLNASEAGFSALNALLEGLERTGRRDAWGFSGWPFIDVSPKTSGTVVFGGKRSFSFKVEISLINEKNKSLGKNSVILNTEAIKLSAGDTKIQLPNIVEGIVSFSNIKAEDLTPVLTIVIVAVNGIPSRVLNTSGYMKIDTGDLEKRNIFPQLGHSDMVSSVAFSPDGRQVISGSWDNTLKLWDIASGREIRTFSGHSDKVISVAFSPDGRQVISGSWDKTLKLWDVASGREIRTFSGHSDRVISVAFSPDGKQVISGSTDKMLKLWDVTSGREIRTFSGHSGVVLSVAFSPDGRQVISGSTDRMICFWNIIIGKEIAQFVSFTDGEWVVITPDGYYKASSNGDKYLNVSVDNNVYGIDQYREIYHKPQIIEARLQGESAP